MNAEEQAVRQQLVSDAAQAASDTVRRETYAAAMQPLVVLTVEQRAELRRQCEVIAGHLQSVAVQMVQAWKPVVDAAIVAVTEFHGALVEAGLVDTVEPSDPAARALHRRRHRNTGPQQRHRAPRRIDPRGCK